MDNIIEILEEEFSEAFEVKDRKALKRTISLLIENVMEREYANRQFTEMKSDIKILAETMKEGFRQIDKRFEAVDKRFEQIDKRFEQVDKRFEEMYHNMDKRFEAVDKRFEQIDKRFEQVDKRFEDLNKRIGFMSWFIPTIVTVLLTFVMAAMKFL